MCTVIVCDEYQWKIFTFFMIKCLCCMHCPKLVLNSDIDFLFCLVLFIFDNCVAYKGVPSQIPINSSLELLCGTEF